MSAGLEALPMWVVYDHPTDYPNRWVARLFVWDAETSQYRATDTSMFTDERQAIDEVMQRGGLTFVHRFPDDDAVIVGTWF